MEFQLTLTFGLCYLISRGICELSEPGLGLGTDTPGPVVTEWAEFVQSS